jgi:hypothetical protein
LRTLDYSGKCVQARTVGGDYYDFLDMGPAASVSFWPTLPAKAWQPRG